MTSNNGDNPWYIKTSRYNHIVNIILSLSVVIIFLLYRGVGLTSNYLLLLILSYGNFLLSFRIIEYLQTKKTIIRAKLPHYVNTGFFGFFWFLFYLILLLFIFFYPVPGTLKNKFGMPPY